MTDSAMNSLMACLCLALMGAAVVSAGCDKPRNGAPERVRLSVFAASSLTDAFADLEAGFERAHPRVDVEVNYAGSQTLRLQLEQGAKADVFASADEKHMAAIVDQKLAKSSEIFAHNELVVIVPAGGGSPVETFEELPEAKRVVVGAKNVPVGIYTEKLLQNARAKLGEGFVNEVRSHVVSRESNVRLVRAKVALGEADAAIVYRTDAVSSKKVRLVPIPDALNVRADYPVAVLNGAEQPELARAFVAYLGSKAGRAILANHGFVTAPQ